ncbi:MAG TPA: ion channel [Gemmatimonadaceae bacterium]|jgi:inward rectifier potassium channel|nr:ion channel [Gemmatimonadaceae bacterium]
MSLPPRESSPQESPIDEEPKDLGFGSVVGGVNEKRLLNRDGTFNQRRVGMPLLSSLSFYHYFLTISWARFAAIVVGGYVGTNALFALAYLACGRDSLVGTTSQAMGNVFWRAFFFSVETLATIGYGNVTPNGLAAHLVMTSESLAGLMMFALITGILFSRFSRPTAAVMFSTKAVVAPYRGVTAFMFRIANGRSNQLVELEAKVLFSRIEGAVRKYDQLTLERTSVVFFPLSWTIVHPINEKSPLFEMSHEHLLAKDAEFMIMLSGTDETFSQTVHARSSYKAEEIVFGHKFGNIYNAVDESGAISIDVRKLSDTEEADPDDWSHHTSTWHHTGHFAGYSPTRKGDR